MLCPITPPVSTNDNHGIAPLPEIIPDANALSAFIADALPGASVAYHIGELARDRYPVLSSLPDPQRQDLCVLADYALRLADAGWAHLLQRRLGSECFVYLLVVRQRRRRAAALPSPVMQAISLAEAA